MLCEEDVDVEVVVVEKEEEEEEEREGRQGIVPVHSCFAPFNAAASISSGVNILHRLPGGG